MKKLFILFTFLIAIGISSVNAQLERTVTLTSANTLADELGDDVSKVTTLNVSGPLGEADFVTMKERMIMLQVLDMSGVTELPYNSEKEHLGCIPYEAFKGKLTLQKVVFPAVLQMIEYSAFQGCSNLGEVDFSLATALKFIYNEAFYICSGLRNLDLSACKSLETIEANAFSRCSNLQTVNLSNCKSLVSIGNGAYFAGSFSDCFSLQTVDLSNCTALMNIGEHAFGGCRNLTFVNLKGCTALQTIENSAFLYCVKLSGFDFTQIPSLTSIGTEAFINCGLTGDIVFASGLNQIGERAFSGNEHVSGFDFSQSPELAVVSAGAFGNCTNLKRVNFTNCSTLNTLNVYAFSNCPLLEEVKINNDFYTSEEGVLFAVDKATLLFYPAGKKEAGYTIPSTVLTIEERSFPYNEHLKELTIPESVLTIKGEAFTDRYNSSKPFKIIMQSATPIDLSQSIGLEDYFVCVPKGAGDAYRKAAIWCDSKIVEIDKIGSVVVSLETAGSLASFLEEQQIHPYTIEELTLRGPMNAHDFEVIREMGLLQKIDMSGATVEDNTIPEGAFYKYLDIGKINGAILLEEVKLPNSIVSIQSEAFFNLSALKQVNMPEHLEFLGASAFWGTSLSSIDFSKTAIRDIAYGAFFNCPITGTLSFPSTLRNLEGECFTHAKVSSIKFRGKEMVIEKSESFNSADKSTCILYVPKGLKKEYAKDTHWSEFKNIEEFGNIVTVSVNNSEYGYVLGAGAYEAGETVVLKAICNEYHNPQFVGWYENGQKLSDNPVFTFTMGDTDRALTARFSSIDGDMLVIQEYGSVIDDQNKLDDVQVVLYGGDLTVEGERTWKPKSFSYRKNYSLLVNSPIETDDVTFNWDTWSGEWHFVTFPYDLKLSEIKLTDSNARMAVRRYDGKSRADDGMGSSWKQLTNDEVMKAHTGYIIRFNSGDGMADGFTTKTGDMQALFNRNSVTIPLQAYASASDLDANWNLVGNPYPCYYNIEQLFEDGLDATITVWSPQLNNYEYYTQDDRGIYLSPLTAFFVQKNKSDLLFRPEGRAVSLPADVQPVAQLRSSSDREVINLVLKGEKYEDRTRIVFNEQASCSYEIGRDAAKFVSMNPDVPSLYTLDAKGNSLAINERPKGNGSVKLACEIPTKGTYTLAMKSASSRALQLVDHKSGTVCDLNQSAYTFESEAGNFADRFELRAGNTVGVEEVTGFVECTVVDGTLFVRGLSEGAAVWVCDALGRIVHTGQVVGTEWKHALLQAGIYYVTWTTASGEQQTRAIKW